MFPIVRWPYLQVRFVSIRKGISTGVQMIKHKGQRLQLLLQMYPSMEKRWIYHRPGFGYTHSLTQEMDVFLQFGKFMYQDNKRKIQPSTTSTTVHVVHLKNPKKSGMSQNLVLGTQTQFLPFRNLRTVAHGKRNKSI